MLALLDAAGLERAHVVGHGWGGAVGWALAGSRPERVERAVGPYRFEIPEGLSHWLPEQAPEIVAELFRDRALGG